MISGSLCLAAQQILCMTSLALAEVFKYEDQRFFITYITKAMHFRDFWLFLTAFRCHRISATVIIGPLALWTVK